jgi:hypothetical protein
MTDTPQPRRGGWVITPGRFIDDVCLNPERDTRDRDIRDAT